MHRVFLMLGEAERLRSIGRPRQAHMQVLQSMKAVHHFTLDGHWSTACRFVEITDPYAQRRTAATHLELEAAHRRDQGRGRFKESVQLSGPGAGRPSRRRPGGKRPTRTEGQGESKGCMETGCNSHQRGTSDAKPTRSRDAARELATACDLVSFCAPACRISLGRFRFGARGALSKA